MDEELKRLLSKSEGINLEFKRIVRAIKSEDIVAFANANGGKIVVGVDEKTKEDGTYSKEILGVSLIDENKRTLIDKAESCIPKIPIQIKEVIDKGKGVYIITIPEGEEKPYCTGNGTYKIRRSGRNAAIDPPSLRKMFLNKTSNLIRLANLDFKNGKFRDALFYYEKVLENDIESFEALIGRTRCCIELLEIETALTSLDMAYDSDHNNLELKVIINELFNRFLSIIDDELWEIESEMQSTTGDDEAELEDERDRYHEMIRTSLAWLQNHPSDSVDFIYMQGIIYELLGDYKKAEDCYKRCLEKDPSYSKASERIEIMNREASAEGIHQIVIGIFLLAVGLFLYLFIFKFIPDTNLVSIFNIKLNLKLVTLLIFAIFPYEGIKSIFQGLRKRKNLIVER